MTVEKCGGIRKYLLGGMGLGVDCLCQRAGTAVYWGCDGTSAGGGSLCGLWVGLVKHMLWGTAGLVGWSTMLHYTCNVNVPCSGLLWRVSNAGEKSPGAM